MLSKYLVMLYPLLNDVTHTNGKGAYMFNQIFEKNLAYEIGV